MDARATEARVSLRRALPSRLAQWLFAIAIGVAAVLAMRAWIISPYRVPSSSMETTLHCARPSPGCEASQADRLLVGRIVYAFRSPHRGDVVVFHAPAHAAKVCGRGIYVKRIIGLPGEVVSEQAGVIYINGRQIKEPYIAPRMRDAMSHVWPRLDHEQYFVLGDNRRNSCDSRWWGPVPRRNLIGPVIARYWPPGRVSIGDP